MNDHLRNSENTFVVFATVSLLVLVAFHNAWVMLVASTIFLAIGMVLYRGNLGRGMIEAAIFAGLVAFGVAFFLVRAG